MSKARSPDCSREESLLLKALLFLLMADIFPRYSLSGTPICVCLIYLCICVSVFMCVCLFVMFVFACDIVF